MHVTSVPDLWVVNFIITPEPDPDSYWGVGALLRDGSGQFFGCYFWVNDPEQFAAALHIGSGQVFYEIRDESVDIALLGEDGPERLQQVREFIAPVGLPWFPVVKRVELGDAPMDFQQRAIPARTSK